jgi:hypothetical protein
MKNEFAISLNALSSILGGIDLLRTKQILSLTNNLLIMVNKKANESKPRGNDITLFHDDILINRILNFVEPGDTYFEISSGYADLAFKISYKIEEKGKAYIFQPDLNLFHLLDMGVFLNNLSNMVIRNNEEFILDQYFAHINSSLTHNAIRIEAKENTCKIINRAITIIGDSDNVMFFIDWKRDLLDAKESLVSLEICLSSLAKQGFMFFDIMQEIDLCNYQENKIMVTDILSLNNIELLAVKEYSFTRIISLGSDVTKNTCAYAKLNKALYKAAKSGDLQSLIELIKSGANVDYIDQDGATSLYIASQLGYVEIVKSLLEYKANTEIKSIFGLTPLFV